MKRNRWVISDTHFSHNNIIRYCDRPFDGILPMNATIIQNWNSVVSPEDEVFHNGDVALGPFVAVPDIIKQLNGYKILILGNHDRKAKQMRSVGFDEVYQDKVIEHNGVRLWLNHYPIFAERKADMHLYGHVHNCTPKDAPKWSRNMCVEVNNYTPVSLDVIVDDYLRMA